ncbi:hypothetical protein BTJ68_01890 [Hortaea werneckii EXF-2000]|uniref:Uncharacterized protein n=1 Tax=Hortaea werneckii EXF-2000 TaxID=1157616 RepID=A0A1Z5TP92_HORWE|nr:hypothetical protein BTJ68_01890 [Hortaea werneckii EXF-2000]
MSFDAGGLAQMTYNNNNGFASNGLNAPSSGFGNGNRSRFNNKRLSVALPPNVSSISENQVDNPTPRTSRSHLLAGLRTQPKTPSVPASAPYSQTEHPGFGASKWASQGYDAYGQGVPQTATAANFNMSNQYAVNAGRQMYSLPEQVLAPPSVYEQMEEMDPAVLQQLQMTQLYLAQRQQQLQQQLATLTLGNQGPGMGQGMQRNGFQQPQMAAQAPSDMYGQQQIQSPVEVPGQPGLYLVYNPAIQGYTYAYDQSAQQQPQASMSPAQQAQFSAFSPPKYESPTPSVQISPPDVSAASFAAAGRATAASICQRIPSRPQKGNLACHRSCCQGAPGAMTASAATFGSQRSAFPPTPMTGTFGPGNARAGDHPLRQPRGPPPLEELTAAPTSKHEGSKNFATRQRRRALDNLMKAGNGRRGVSRSSNGSPISENDISFPIAEESEDLASFDSNAGSRKMSPIGSEMKEKRNSNGSTEGYFGLSSASSSEGEDGAFKQPPTPATPVSANGGDRKKMMLGVLSAAEKRRSFVF